MYEPVLLGDGSLLVLAIQCGHKDIALALLASGANVHTEYTGGWTALHWACYQGFEEVVQALINRGSRMNSRDSLGRTPLMLAKEWGKKAISMRLMRAKKQLDSLIHACSRGDLSAVQTFLNNGASILSISREKQEKLLHLACREGDAFIAHTLLKNGCSVSILSREEQEKLLRLACCEDDVFIAHTLLKNDCSVSILSREEQEKLLRLACCEDDVFIAHTLLKNDCSVSILSREEQEKLLRLACCEDDVFIAHTLLKNDCSVSILSREEQEKLLHLACHWGDAFVVRTLLENGCSVSILSGEEQERLLHLACRENNAFIAHTLLKNGCSVSILSREEQEKLLRLACCEDDAFIAHTLLKNDCSVSILSREEQEKLLCCACLKGDMLVVEALLANGCNMSCLDLNGCTPLMVATEKGHEEVVKKLILAGANLRMQTPNGDTALHIAATRDRIQCGILLAEGGASVRTKNKQSQTPLDLARAEFKEAIKQALSFTTRKAVCIIGNAEGGKSTLIAALQAESNSFLGRIFNRFRRVSDHRQRTAGIETVAHCSQRYGEVLFFDFAGQDDYHGPHQMFLESFLSKPGISMTLLLVVKTTEEEDAILHQLHRWLSPVALMATPASPPHVIIIGSFLDKVRSKDEATARLTRCVEATRKDLEMLPLEFVGSSFLNCRQPQSNGIDRIGKLLQEIPIPEFRATHARYSLAWVLSQIRSSIKTQAVQLHEFSVWVQDNKDNLPQTIPPPEEVCQDLSAAGHALYLPNKEDPPKSWLVLDLPSILHDVYGTLFSQFGVVVNEFGLLHCRHLAKLFQHLHLEMVQQLLISLEFCLPVDPSILKVDLSKLTQSEEASGWLFFPALISAKRPQPTSECVPQQSVHYLRWQLRTAKKHSISARLLQTILLRLAAHFVVKLHLSEGVQQHCCSIWWNGIAWQSKKGVDVTVHITNNRVIQVIGTSVTSSDKSFQYMMDVISDILSTVHQLSPNFVADSYIVHRPKMATLYEDVTTLPHQELFPVTDIQNSIRHNEEFSLSLKDSNTGHSTRAAVCDLFGGCTPSLEDIGRINWPQLEPGQTQSPTGPNQPEPSQSQSPTGPSQPEPSQTQSPTGPSQPEPSQTHSPTGPSQPEPSQTQSPTGPSQPEPSQPEPSQTQSPTGPSQPEPGQTQSPTGPSQPEPSQTQSLTGPSQPEPSQTHSPTGPSQPEPSQTQSPTGPSQPEPSQPEPSQTQSPTGPSQPEPGQTQSPTGPSQPEPSQTQPPTGPSQPEPSQTQSPTGPSQPEPSQTQSLAGPSQPDVLSGTVSSEFML